MLYNNFLFSKKKMLDFLNYKKITDIGPNLETQLGQPYNKCVWYEGFGHPS